MVFSSTKSKAKGAAAAQQPQQPRQEQCVALCDYYSAADDEISFKKGDVITVTTKGNDSGFWSGYVAATSMAGSRKAKKDNNVPTSPTGTDANASSKVAPNGNKIGLFPNCMVTSNCRMKSSTSSFQNKAAAMYSYDPKDMTEMRFEKYDVLTIIGPSPHAGWWLATNDSAKKRLEQDASDSVARGGNLMASGTVIEAVAGTQEKPLLVPTNFITCDIVVAMYSFQGRERHELSFNAGDVLHVKRRLNDGWWEAILDGQRGIFPSNYTDPNVCTLSPPLFCGHCKTLYASSSTSTFNDCKTCGRHEEIINTMKRALEEHFKQHPDAGSVTSSTSGNKKDKDGAASSSNKCDLFEYIELDPKVGGKSALLTTADIIKSAGGGVGKGVAGVATGLAHLHFSHNDAAAAGSPDEYSDALINDDEIFHRRGETKSVLAEIEKKRQQKAAATPPASGGGAGAAPSQSGDGLTYVAGSYGRVI